MANATGWLIAKLGRCLSGKLIPLTTLACPSSPADSCYATVSLYYHHHPPPTITTHPISKCNTILIDTTVMNSTNMLAKLATVCESWYGDLGLCISHHLARDSWRLPSKRYKPEEQFLYQYHAWSDKQVNILFPVIPERRERKKGFWWWYDCELVHKSEKWIKFREWTKMLHESSTAAGAAGCHNEVQRQ